MIFLTTVKEVSSLILDIFRARIVDGPLPSPVRTTLLVGTEAAPPFYTTGTTKQEGGGGDGGTSAGFVVVGTRLSRGDGNVVRLRRRRLWMATGRPSAAATAGKSTAWTKTNPRSTPPPPLLSLSFPPPFSFLRVRSPLDAKVAFAGRGEGGRGEKREGV